MPRATVLIPIATGALYLTHALVFGPYVADDAGISLAYARNLVAGFGPVLYAGAPAVEGFSNPLWTAVMAVAVALRLDFANGIPLLKALGFATGAGVLLVTMRSRRIAYPDDLVITWLAPALLAAWTGFVFWSGAGLENPLYALALLLAASAQLTETERGRGVSSAFWLLAAALTRPEGVAFYVPFLIHRIVVRRVSWDTLRWSACFLVPFLFFIAIRYAVFGDIVPNTYHAKILDRSLARLPAYLLTPSDPGFQYVRGFFVVALPVVALAVAGLLDRRAWRTNLLFGGICGGMVLYAVYVGGDFWTDGRFLTAAMPFLALAAQHGVHVTAGARRSVALVTASVALTAFAFVNAGRSLEVRRQCVDGWFPSLQGRLEQGRRVRALARQYGIEHPLYLDPDIGGPSVLGIRVLDLGGLTDIHIARFKYYPPFFRDYIFREQRPEIIRTHGPWTRSSRITRFPEFADQYVAIQSTDDENGLHGEFIRKDLLAGGPRPARATMPPSFTQAVADGRAARAREDQREQDGWIEYYSDNGYHAKLRAAFTAHERARTLPQDVARLAQLYYGLLSASDLEAAERVRERAGIAKTDRVTFLEDGVVRFALLGWRTVPRPLDRGTVFQLFLLAERSPDHDYDVAVRFRTAGEPHTVRHALEPTRPGSVVTVETWLDLDAGEYVAEATLQNRADPAVALSTPSGQSSVTLGPVTVWR